MFSKNYARRGAPVFIGVYALALVLSYLSYLLYYELSLSEEIFELINYVTAFFMDAVSFIMPMLMCALMLAVYECKGLKYALLRCAVITAPVAVYTFVSEYINYTLRGADFGEALVIGALWSLAAAIAFYAEGVLMFFIVKYLAKRAEPTSYQGGVFDFSSPTVKAIFTVCLAKFAIMLGIEIYTAISYLAEYAGTYLIGEVLYMIGRFLFIFGELFAAHTLTVIFKKHLSGSFCQE